MEVKCSICCKKENITKIHKDYQKLAKMPEAIYICELCKFRVKHQAVQGQKESRPI